MSRAKIKNIRELKRIAAALKKRGKTVVFTNGCFDLLHYGHVMYLQKAKAKGDLLVVAVNSDASVKRIKGKNRPIVNEHDRARVIAGLESVDYVVLFNKDNPLELIRQIQPDILVKGADWKKNKIIGADIVHKNRGRVVTIKLSPGRSTTSLIKKIIAKD